MAMPQICGLEIRLSDIIVMPWSISNAFFKKAQEKVTTRQMRRIRKSEKIQASSFTEMAVW